MTQFRGKAIDNGGWVHGFLYQLPFPSGVGSMILTTNNIHQNSSLAPAHDLAFTLWVDLFPVKTETIGQFTGLRDKNGKKVFDGDIVLCTRKNVHIEGRPKQDFIDKCIIYYDNKKCGFMFYCKLDCGAWVGNLNFSDDRAEESYIEVVGNIYDNPEMAPYAVDLFSNL